MQASSELSDSCPFDVSPTAQPDTQAVASAPERQLLSKQGPQLEPPPDYAVRNYVNQARAGLIEYHHPAVHIERLLVQAIRATQEHVAVVWPNMQQVRSLVPVLRRHFERLEIQADKIWKKSKLSRISLVTWPGLGVVCRERDIKTCLVLEPAGLLNARKQAAIPPDARIIGFQPSDRRLVRSERDDLSKILTDRWLVVPLHGHVMRSVSVQTWPLRIARQKHHASVLEAKRASIWRCPQRNRLVAGLARRLTARTGRESICRSELQLETDRIIVAVENVEHAAALQTQRLQDWPIYCLEGADLSGLPRQTHPTPIRKCPFSLPGPAIVTHSALPYLRDIDTIVRADAGIGTLPLATEVLACPLDDSQSLVVFDVADIAHPVLGSLVKKRVQTYRKDRWSVSQRLITRD